MRGIMNLQKRDCPIKIEIYNVKAGWLTMKLCINGEECDYTTSYCMGDNFNALLKGIYYLHPVSYDFDFSGTIVENAEYKGMAEGKEVTYEVPHKATFDWCEEPASSTWELEVEPTLDREFELSIKITTNRDNKKEVRKYKVSYKDFSYALAKACTELLKKQGINGFHQSYWEGDINLRYLLFIKAIALDADEMIETTWNKNDEACSDINKELELLMFDM